jgi:predicted nucleotidyltransferase
VTAPGLEPRCIAALVARHPQLRLLVLFGSRARGDHRADSDWDFGYLAGAGLDPAALHADLVTALGTEAVDLVDLDRASGLLRFRAARDGERLHDADGNHVEFRLAAIRAWCDMEPVLRRVYAETLDELQP